MLQMLYNSFNIVPQLTLLRKYVLRASATSSLSMCMWGPMSTANTVRTCRARRTDFIYDL